ncbi:MAG: DUF4349 domain-containing protein [Anaerolineae bacterium]|nr:DUF4349 domain-containing protein [Anaerolineae bacterium]MDH7474765.1 DUF4349 domain-containing protein [Anaerolineae bacterium]
MRKRGFLYLSLIVLSALAVAGCASRAATAPPQEMVKEVPVVDQASGARWAGETGSYQYNVANLPQEQMIIYTVDMELIVHDTAASLESVRALVAEFNGYIASSSSGHQEGILTARLTIRVPADDLETVLERLRALGQLESESQSSQDVTDQYVDLDAQLKNLELAEQELRELLQTRQETGKTEEILEVYRELINIRGQIEQIKGRMQYLENLSAMATINLTLTPDALAQPVVIGGWQPQGTARDAARALVKAVQFLINAAIWIVIFVIPTLILLALPFVVLVLIIRAWRRRRRQRQVAG